MRQVLNFAFFAIFVASFSACFADVVEVNHSCYQWEGCTTWWNETRGYCLSVCGKSDTYKRGSVDCTKPCLSNGFCVGIRRRNNLCLCESECRDLPYCMSFMYEECENWSEKLSNILRKFWTFYRFYEGDPCKCIEFNPWDTLKVDNTATTKKKKLLKGVLLEQEKEVGKICFLNVQGTFAISSRDRNVFKISLIY